MRVCNIFARASLQGFPLHVHVAMHVYVHAYAVYDNTLKYHKVYVRHVRDHQGYTPTGVVTSEVSLCQPPPGFVTNPFAFFISDSLTVYVQGQVYTLDILLGYLRIAVPETQWSLLKCPLLYIVLNNAC